MRCISSTLVVLLALVMSTVYSFSFNRGAMLGLARNPVLSISCLRKASHPSSTRIQSSEDVDAPIVSEVKDVISTGDSTEEAEKKKFFGLSLTDPQDWITVFLSGVILYQTIDLIVFYGGKLLGTGSS